jgi:hypothetical protein
MVVVEVGWLQGFGRLRSREMGLVASWLDLSVVWSDGAWKR